VAPGQHLCDPWSAFQAAGWVTSFRVIVSDAGDIWVAEAAKNGEQVEGRAASPEGAWQVAYRKALWPAAGVATAGG
jgi:hypothetical protein